MIVGVPAGTDTLRTRMIGYTPAAIEVTVAGGEIVDVDINLTAQAVNLSEMVVVGYGEQRAGNITGAVTNVTPEEFNTGRIVTPTELIQNKVAGVQVVENNEPGGSDLHPDSRSDVDQREQRSALRHRRRAARDWLRERDRRRARSAQLPQLRLTSRASRCSGTPPPPRSTGRTPPTAWC